MGVKQWIQGVLPVFNEPILPGDYVRITKCKPVETYVSDEAAAAYVGQVGQVTELYPDQSFYPLMVQFSDGAHFCYDLDEVERKS